MPEYNYHINPEQVRQSHDRLVKSYRMDAVDHVPVVQTTKVELGYSIYDIVYKKEAMLHQQLSCISATMRHRTDYCPMLAPWHGVGIYAELFGCDILYTENDWPWAKPLITDNPEDVYRLKPKKLEESELWRHLFETIDFFQKNTKGDIPLCATDPQGPMSTASMIWRTEDLLCACYTNPVEVHYLLNLVTDVFIEFYDRQMAAIEHPAYPGWGFPLGETGRGISMSDDNAAFLSPELYKEFCVPYNAKIAEHFNGLYLHSCGNWMHNIPVALEIPKLRAINYHSAPRDGVPEKYRQMTGERCAVWTGPTDADTGFAGDRPDDRIVYGEYLVPGNMKAGGKGLIITGLGDYGGAQGKTPDEMNEFYDWVTGVTAQYARTGEPSGKKR